MSELETLRERLGDPMKDTKLNLSSVLAEGGALTGDQRWGVALASAAASRHAPLTSAVLKEARKQTSAAVIEDALAAASLMAMNNVFYRFRHLIGKSSYSDMPARLRMQRIAKPSTNKADFELFCLAVSAINACETCLRAHDEAVLASGLSEAHVHDAVRIASTLHAAAVSLEVFDVLEATPEGAA